MKEIVIATRNPGKLEEFKVLMKDLEVEYVHWKNGRMYLNQKKQGKLLWPMPD